VRRGGPAPVARPKGRALGSASTARDALTPDANSLLNLTPQPHAASSIARMSGAPGIAFGIAPCITPCGRNLNRRLPSGSSTADDGEASLVRGQPGLYSLAPLADLYPLAPGIFCTGARIRKPSSSCSSRWRRVRRPTRRRWPRMAQIKRTARGDLTAEEAIAQAAAEGLTLVPASTQTRATRACTATVAGIRCRSVRTASRRTLAPWDSRAGGSAVRAVAWTRAIGGDGGGGRGQGR